MRRRHGVSRRLAELAATLAVAASCQGSTFSGAEEEGGSATKGDGALAGLPEDAVAAIEIFPMDIWAQALPAGYVLRTVCDGAASEFSAGERAVVPLSSAASCEISLSFPEHHDLALTATYDGRDTLDGFALSSDPESPAHGVSLGFSLVDVGERSVPVYSLFLGLRHKWFSAEGRPARRGNRAELLKNGEQTWIRVHEDLLAAQDAISLSTWWWESDFELLRDLDSHPYLSVEQRRDNTMLAILESLPAYKRIMVGEFWQQDSFLGWISSDAELRAHVDDMDDQFEFLSQANPTTGKFEFEPTPFVFGDRVRASVEGAENVEFAAEKPIHSTVPTHQVDLTLTPADLEVELASYHQKFMTIDDSLAYIGGMNVRSVDWDTSDHLVFDERREYFEATTAERQEVMDKKRRPDNVPRKDYMLRIEGPAAQDAAEVFAQRWEFLRESGVDGADRTSPFEIDRTSSAMPEGVQLQVTATLPEPFLEHAIAETWFNAVAEAEHYIYIEDQYFRIPMLVEAIIARMAEVPDLRLVVVTGPMLNTDGGCYWTSKTHWDLKERYPDRYQMLQMRSFDKQEVVEGSLVTATPEWADVNLHAKIMLVDDKFLSVGSCNKNNRGLIYEAELNAVVVDEAWVTHERAEVLKLVLPPGTEVPNDVADWYDALADAAAWNDRVWTFWNSSGQVEYEQAEGLPNEYQPQGFLFTLEPVLPQTCTFGPLSPDLF